MLEQDLREKARDRLQPDRRSLALDLGSAILVDTSQAYPAE